MISIAILPGITFLEQDKETDPWQQYGNNMALYERFPNESSKISTSRYDIPFIGWQDHEFKTH